jgi:predicted ATP-grasp superfamily ATP-dependent carboligase
VTRHSVLVTSGEQRSSLAVVRSLGRHGHRVLVAANRRGSLSGVSRYASREVVLPSPLENPDGFVNGVVDLCAAERLDVVIPTTDDALLALLPARERLAPAILPVGSERAYRAASDKGHLQSIAPQFGIAVPRQITVCQPEDGDPSALTFPVAVKPSKSVSDDSTRIQRNAGVRYATNATELRQILATSAAESFPLLVQERVVGPGVGVFLLLWEGREIAAFSHQRIREKPPGGGVSVYAESVEADPALVERSRNLLSHLGFNGVAMVEYKVSRETGIPYLMEINGRFWGSLQLAIDAGVDFPQLLISVAVDGIVPAAPTAIPGVRTRWWWGDFDHLLARFRRSDAELALPPESPSRWRVLRDFMHMGSRTDRNQILRLDDPRPAVQETLDWMRRR